MIFKKLVPAVSIVIMVFLMALCGRKIVYDRAQNSIGSDISVNKALNLKGLSTSPKDGSVGVILNKKITIVFNKSMNPSTIDRTTFMVKGIKGIKGTVSCNGHLASFTPSAPLIPNTIYTATISTNAESEGGISLESDFIWTFYTQLHSDEPLIDLISVEKAGVDKNAKISYSVNPGVGL